MDYLLKIDLDEEKPERSMKLAAEERDKRRKLSQNSGEGIDPADAILHHMEALFSPGGERSVEQTVGGLRYLDADQRVCRRPTHHGPGPDSRCRRIC